MLVNIYDDNKIVCTADIEFAPSNVFVKSIASMDSSWADSHMICGEDVNYLLSFFIESRTPLLCTKEYDEYAFDVLQIDKNKRYWFGRMCGYRVAVGLLNHFISENDTISIYPVHTELVNFVLYESILYQMYVLRPKEEEL